MPNSEADLNKEKFSFVNLMLGSQFEQETSPKSVSNEVIISVLITSFIYNEKFLGRKLGIKRRR